MSCVRTGLSVVLAPACALTQDAHDVSYWMAAVATPVSPVTWKVLVLG